MPAAHSSSVSWTSEANACRWWTRLCRTSRVRSEGAPSKLASTACVSCSSERLRVSEAIWASVAHLHEGAHACDVPADDQRLDRLGALVGVDDLDVAHVADDVVLEQDPVAAEHVARLGDH